MLKFIIKTPIKAIVLGTEEQIQDMKAHLTYVNTSAMFQKQKIEKNFRWKQRDPMTWREALDEARAKVKNSLVFFDGTDHYVRPASIAYLPEECRVKNEIEYPAPKPLKWKVPIPFEPYPYQVSIIDRLLEEKHGCVSAATGTGKTLCIMTIAQRLGLKTVIAVPTASIFNEMLQSLTLHLGKDLVGGLGDGKKDFKKQIVVAIYRSLSLAKPDTPVYEELSKAKVWIGDESHVIGAPTLEKISNDLFSETPYRFFFSGTQVRGDGTDKLLQSVIGRQVFEITTAEAIKGGYICDHSFKVVCLKSSDPHAPSDDPLQTKRIHYLYNDNIADFVTKLCEASVPNKKILVLVDEVEQVVMLAKRMKVPFAYAIGSPDQRLKDMGLPPMTPAEAVELFDQNKYQVLVGTSCISIGTNIYSMHITVNWQGSGSEVRSKQGAVGRSVRLLHKSKYASINPPKTHVTIVDFDVYDIPQLKSSLNDRVEYYKQSGTKIEFIKFG